MLFRRRKDTTHVTCRSDTQEKSAPIPLQAYKLSVRFDILPEISYLDDNLCALLVDFFPLLHGFPENVWISQKKCEEGLDFCQLNFWAFSKTPNAIKEFSIWFQGIFRDTDISSLLERFVLHAIEKPNQAEVCLSDWSRLHVTQPEVREIVSQEMLRQRKKGR